MQVTRLNASDAPEYRELMLEAYKQAEDAFTSTAEERASEPLSWWEKRVACPNGLSESFGIFAGKSLVGSVTLEYSAKPKKGHSVSLIGMYIRPANRGSGAGAALVKAAIASAEARAEIRAIRLTVTEGNEPATRLYKSVGFIAWGTEPQAIRTPTGFKSKVHMVLLFPRAIDAA
jgi:ribosomal protein S18 acetylase RimI-like enzyme